MVTFLLSVFAATLAGEVPPPPP
ncbi:hypothetical protein CP082626L3_0491A, partial [Chlamydia psittaci 08-2626_L3]